MKVKSHHLSKTGRFRLAGLLFVILLTLLLACSAGAAVNNTKNIKKAPPGQFVYRKKGWYYKLDSGGYLKDRLAKVDGKIYYFSPKGLRLSGFQKIGKYTYYFGDEDEGYMYRDQWYKKSSTRVYYFPKNGRMPVSKLMEVDGKSYYFTKKGYRKYGMATIGDHKYYFGTKNEGFMHTSEFVLYKNHYYYCNQNGEIVTGRYVLDGNVYYFDETGKAYTGTMTIDGLKYYFNDWGMLLKKGADLEVASDCAFLVNVSTEKVAFAKNEDVPHAIGGLANIMNCILALEKANLEDKVTFSTNAVAQPGLTLKAQQNEKFTLEDLLSALVLAPYNDIALAVGEHISGNETKYVQLMNSTAKNNGWADAHFGSANGRDGVGTTYATAEIVALMTLRAYQDSTFRKMIKRTSWTFKSSLTNEYTVSTLNQLLLDGKAGVEGVMYANTTQAGHCFIGLIKTQTGQRYVSVVLGATTKDECFNDTKSMLNYAYSTQ